MPAQKRSSADKIAKDNNKKQKKEPTPQELMLMMQTLMASLPPQRPLEAPAVALAVDPVAVPVAVPVVAQNNEVPAQPARAVTRSRRAKAANPVVAPDVNPQQNDDNKAKQDEAKFAEQLMKQAKAIFEVVAWVLLVVARWTFDNVIRPNLVTIICVVLMYVYMNRIFTQVNNNRHVNAESMITHVNDEFDIIGE